MENEIKSTPAQQTNTDNINNIVRFISEISVGKYGTKPEKVENFRELILREDYYEEPMYYSIR